jgi:hypothetical protein
MSCDIYLANFAAMLHTRVVQRQMKYVGEDIFVHRHTLLLLGHIELYVRGHSIFWPRPLEVMNERPAKSSTSALCAREHRNRLNEGTKLTTHKDGPLPHGQPSTHQMHDFAISYHRPRGLAGLATTSRGSRPMARPAA